MPVKLLIKSSRYLIGNGGIGTIPKSGWEVNEAYRHFDARNKFNLVETASEDTTTCIAGGNHER